MKKQYGNPEILMVELSTKDIITLSTGDGFLDELPDATPDD